MTITDTTITTSDHLELFLRVWGEPSTSKAIVVLVHGIGEHCQRYNHVAEKMNARELCMVGFDQRGCGLSQGRRGVINSEEQLMADFGQVLAYANRLNPDIPIFLYGHSMGALEVLTFTEKYKPMLKGVIATSPPLDTSTLSTVQKLLIKALKPIFPHLVVPSNLYVDGLSRDKNVVRAYREDELVHDKASVLLGAFLQDAPAYVLEHADMWQLPLYLAHGTSDSIAKVAGSDVLAERVKTQDFTYQRWEGLYHETHNEPEKDVVIASMLDWIIAHN
jgi:alpha-beta hydrolase superfamily lysophospholipase